MARNVEKKLQEYQKLIDGELKNSRMADFYSSEIDELYELSGGDIFSAIYKAMDFGFVCGYKAGKRAVESNRDNKSTK